MKKIILYILFCVPLYAVCQNANKYDAKKERVAKEKARLKKMQDEAEKGAIIFNKQSALSISLRSDGYAIGYEQGKYKKIDKTNMWWFQFGERKHTKEEKLVQEFAGLQVGNPYIFGKINNFYFLNIGFGQQKMLGGKSSKNGIAVSAIYGGGLTLGMLKPYYLEVFSRVGFGTEEIKYSDDNIGRYLDADSIVGSAGFGKGFGEMKYVPGFFARGAVRFDYGRFNDIVSALEIGLTTEYYTQKMPIMLLNKEKNFFVTGYISLIFGSRK